LVVDTARWLPGRLVLLAPTSFDSFDLDGKMANTGLSKAQVEESPPLLEDLPVSRHYETELRNYYGWPSYWSHPAGMAFPYPPALYPVGHPLANETRMPEEWIRILEERRERQDEHLRSADELIGYRISAKDEDFGEVKDLLLDLERHRVVDVVLGSRKWLPG